MLSKINGHSYNIHIPTFRYPRSLIFFIVTKGDWAHLEVHVFQILQAQYLKTEAAENLLHLKTLTK